MIFALAGNQNCGKTTLFNSLTGANQHVGNFPGVTVDQKMGDIRDAKGSSVVDLPGIYSIRPYTSEEIVTRDFILNGHPDGIINIVDATNIERNLYLTLQLLELRIPMVLALNMMDEVRANGGTIDVKGLSKRLGIPVIPISAAKNEGVSELVSKAVDTAKNKILPSVLDFCPDGPVHRCIHSVSHVIEDHARRVGISARFAATKLIEGDQQITELLELDENEKELLEHSIVEMEQETELDRNAALADMRYSFIESVVKDTVIKCHESAEHQRSVKIDEVLTGRFTAIPVFIGIMLLIFFLTFNVIGSFLSDLLAAGIDWLTAMVDQGLTVYGINPVVHSLIIDGIFAGVGSVLSFLPIIVTLFFFLSILEDTGYMARVAFVMDKLLRKIGLSGRSIVPMLIGFGCTVPAVMATRTLSSDRDRKMTIMLTPFMSCSAKIPIYAVFASAFFPSAAALVMIILYFGGMLVGVLAALVMKKTVFSGKPVPFVMELPNYRFPSAKSVALLLWDKAKDFLQRAFTVIFLGTIVIWFLQTFDTRLNVVTDNADSLLASLGALISPLLAPLGNGDWRVATALLSGFTAKEAVVSTLGVLLGVGTAELPAALHSMFSPLSAAAFLAFTLLYTPCVAAIATIKNELGSGWKTIGVVIMQCAIAWAAGTLIYQIGSLLI
ncbi:MAG TPA: ferrous iron transport protein B [Candidatus Faecivivens stercoripullorum]|uniref:Ferrous iron transport protein B n=1 Tax=Candidatus Faecivivens stercoripullorum TaxID=2840805 RepID=A0A9D1H805_9FIRM|nr:ferrous iron transport protein B [Candidatus Faecivivens stercoripullorum]